MQSRLAQRSPLLQRPRPQRAERGAVLVEAAIAIPLLMMLIFGGLELGGAWEARSATTSGVRTGLLRSASLGDRPEADLRTLQSVIGEVGADNVDDMDWIIVFSMEGATNPDVRIEQCAAAIAAGGLDSLCAVYPTSVLQDVVDSITTIDDFDDGGNDGGDNYACDASKLDHRFCAASRTEDGAVVLGVAVQFNAQWKTGIIPGEGVTYREYAISSTLVGEQADAPVVDAALADLNLGPNVALISAPSSVDEGLNESDSQSFVWAEAGPLILDAPITVNRSSTGTISGNTDENVEIPAGTEVCSYYVQIDLVNSGSLSGSLQFDDAEIIGVIFDGDDLEDTDDILGSDGTDYSSTVRGLEGNDSLDLDIGTSSISWDVYQPGSGWTDDFRILTTCD